MNLTSYPRCLALVFCLLACASWARPQNCNPPAIVANAKSTNIFTPQQEMILGDLSYQRLLSDVRFVKDPQLNEYVTRIGARLARHLPPTGLEYRFYIIDFPQANAFNIPGGYVLLSRKLIGFAATEDELAGVIAHELGHAVVRHGATDFSESLKKILNVTQVSDRKDITDKYNLLLEKARTKSLGQRKGHENEQQLEADRLGVFALTAAGYNPEAFASLFDRLVETKGKTGTWFGDLFGTTSPEQKRLREIIKAAPQLPPECRETQATGATADFLTWQAAVVSYRAAKTAEELPGLLWKKELTPKLRSDIKHFAFSPDGSHLLAQDDFSITVMRREPLTVLFQIPVSDAQNANFTPDGQHIVFGTESLRSEKWSVAARKPLAVRELVIRRDCWEHQFSPDGNYLACIDYGLNASVLNTQTGQKVWEKKKFYQLSLLEYVIWSSRLGRKLVNDEWRKFFRIGFSPDTHFATFARSSDFRFTTNFGGTVFDSEDAAFALDLTTLKPISTGSELKKVMSRPFAFLDAQRIVGMVSGKPEESGVFSFPEGKRLARFNLNGLEVKATANPDYVIIKPLANTKLGVFDVKQGIIASGVNKADATIWRNLMVQETRSGLILLSEVAYNTAEKRFDSKDLGRLEIPAAEIGELAAAEVSDSFQWLAVSSQSRGGVWDLATGERQIFLRGFRGAYIGNNGMGLGDFPKLDNQAHSLVMFNGTGKTASLVRELPPRGAQQVQRFIIARQSLKPPDTKPEEKKKDDGKPAPPKEEETTGPPLNREVRLEVREIVQDKMIWSREFPKFAPGYVFDEFSGRLVLYWPLSSEEGRAKLDENTALKSRAEALGNKNDDYLVEIVDAFEGGKTVGMLLVETGQGSFDIKGGFSEGDWLALYDSQQRVLLYSVKTGELQHRFFGTNATINPSRNQILVENLPGELVFYDLATGERQARITLASGAALARFSLDGKRLFVLSKDQTSYAFDTGKLAPSATLNQISNGTKLP